MLTALFIVGCTASHPLEGRWKTQSSDGTESVLWFKSDGTFEALTKGETLVGKWVFHEESDPKRLELIFEENRKVITIANLIGDQLLIEPREDDAEMPTEFSDDVQKYRRQ
jgi:hypothetical protein